MLDGLKKNPCLLAIILLALLARMYFEITYVDFNMDKARQLFIAQCLSDGDGISYCTADLSDLSRTTCNRVNLWAIGYPILITALNALVGDFVLSSLVLDILGLIILFIAFCSLFRLLGLGGKPLILFMLFTAFTFTPYYYTGSTDFLAAALFLYAAALALESLSSKRSTPLSFIFIGILAFTAAFLRYAYYPFLGIIPLFLVLAGIRLKDKKVFRGGFLVGCSSFALLAGLLLFHRSYFGAALHLKGSGAAYIHHLLLMDSFPLKAVFFTDILDQNIRATLPGFVFLLRPVSVILSLLVLGVIIYHGLRCMTRRTEDPAPQSLPFLYLMVFLTLLVNVALFSYYSVRNPPQSGWIDFWTYVQETRYYAPSMFFIQITLVLVLFKPFTKNHIIKYALGCFLGAALCFSVSFGLYRAYKIHVAEGPTKYSTRVDEVSKVVEMINTLHHDSATQIVYADGISVHNACLVALRSSARIILDYDYETLIKNPLKASKPTTLFVRIHENRSDFEDAFIEFHSLKPVIELYRSDIYRVDL